MARRSQGLGQLELGLSELSEAARLREENGTLRTTNDRLQTQNTELMTEINRLQRLVYSTMQEDVRPYVHDESVQVPEEEPNGNAMADFRSVTKRSDIRDKIALFRSYFRGRDDVYAVRA